MGKKRWYSYTMWVPKLLEMCLISVRNLSENSQLQKTVRCLSKKCQLTVRNQSVTKMCQNCLRKYLEMGQKCIVVLKCVRI